MLMVSKPSLAIGMSAVTVGPLHIKPYSPMSAGAWGLMVFSTCAFLCAAETWLADRRGRGFPRVRVVAGVIGIVAGFFLAAYPGVLLGATARPLFISAHWLGALFLAVGAATGSAAIALVLAWLRGSAAQDALARVMRVSSVALVTEIVALALVIVSIRAAGSAGLDAALGQLVTGPFSIAFWLGAVFLGAVLPLLLGTIGRSAAHDDGTPRHAGSRRRLPDQVRPDRRRPGVAERSRVTNRSPAEMGTNPAEGAELARRPAFQTALAPLGPVFEAWQSWSNAQFAPLTCTAEQARRVVVARRAAPGHGASFDSC